MMNNVFEGAIQECLSLFIEQTPDVISIVNEQGMIQYQSPSAAHVLGRAPQEIIGKSVFAVVHPQDLRNVVHVFHEAIKNPGNPYVVKYRFRHGDGSWRHMESVGRGVANEGSGVRVVIDSREAAARRRSSSHRSKLTKEQLWQLATRDELTGLFNRRQLGEGLTAAVRSAKRHGHPLSVCLCDLDYFKSVNDIHGHLRGDEVLQTFGGFIREALRVEDLAGRFGGDEFCIVFPHAVAVKAAVAMGRIIDRLRHVEFRSMNGETFSVTASAGIVQLSSGDHTKKEVLERADQALYEAKRAGRDRFVVKEAPAF